MASTQLERGYVLPNSVLTSGGAWRFQKCYPNTVAGVREHFGSWVQAYTSHFIFHEEQSQVTTRHMRTTKVAQLKSREIWCSALRQTPARMQLFHPKTG
jgi:hypothetical protein